jgi:predicted DNA-binding transcriptional regulator AlpA
MDTRNVTLDDVRGWPPLVSMAAACSVLGVGRSTGYELADKDDFPCKVVRVGSRIRVVTASLLALLEGETAAELH